MSFVNCTRRQAFRALFQSRTYAAKPAQAADAPASKAAAVPQSSCPADTILVGLNYLKGQPPVLAKPDEEYPEWLWTILEPKQHDDPRKALRAKRRIETKQRIKDENFMSTQ
ncbi:mitochondrial ribosomal protein L37-domain-containing protein [Schizophyllum amplum]|uniref:Large ribosomal subunit protein mL54 n=1 Tax=Schizophyllum amplum TaxID=97359 RepID=A0A550C560_9AGAR|nr:mitochondrial ribosomal protein L37-domain-containing protein [Auriculariopsis ampla]